MKKEEGHAPISPSSIHRSLECPASLIPLEHPTPERPSPYAAEGDLFHELAAGATSSPAKREALKQLENEEMREHLLHLMKHRRRLKDLIGRKAIYKELIEERVKFSENIYGTIDWGLLYVRHGQKKIYAEDTKYGAGHGVPIITEAGDLNPQIATYIAAIRRTHDWPATRATGAIYQPRNTDHTDKKLDQHVVTARQLNKWDTKLTRLEKKALPILAGEAKPRPRAGSWCQFCKRIPVCPAYAKMASAAGILALHRADPLPQVEEQVIIRKAGDPSQNGVPPQQTRKVRQLRPKKPQELTDEELSAILENADVLRKFLKEVEIYAAGRCLSADPLRGWKVVEGRKQRKWPDDQQRIIAALEQLGLAPTRTILRGVTEIERALCQQVSKSSAREIVNNLTVYNQPKPKLVPETDPRPALGRESFDLLTSLDDENENVYS